MSFESDNDEEIDAAEIEEEDWVDYINRSTNDAMEKIEYEKIRCWNKTQKNEMETGDENCHITSWTKAAEDRGDGLYSKKITQ